MRSAIWQRMAPPVPPPSQATALATMGAFVLVFVIRMAVATMGKKEGGRLRRAPQWEDRFRSLIQNSSDVPIISESDGTCTFPRPRQHERFSGFRRAQTVGHRRPTSSTPMIGTGSPHASAADFQHHGRPGS